MKDRVLTWGDLALMPERAAAHTVGEKSAKAILRMANPSEGPNMKTKGEALRFVVMAVQKIHKSQPETSEGEALGGS